MLLECREGVEGEKSGEGGRGWEGYWTVAEVGGGTGEGRGGGDGVHKSTMSSMGRLGGGGGRGRRQLSEKFALR